MGPAAPPGRPGRPAPPGRPTATKPKPKTGKGGARDGSADAHLRKADRKLAKLIDAGGPISADEDRRGRVKSPYQALLRAIVGQQLSTKAAYSINERVEKLLGGGVPTPKKIIEADPQDLRDAGLSWSKVSYVLDLAEKVDDGELKLKQVSQLPDEEVVEELTKVKGIGRWSAEMFLIFHLGRPDVLPVGDLGIRRAAEITYGLKALPEPDELERIAEPWRPHRTLASLYLWRSLHNEPVSAKS